MNYYNSTKKLLDEILITVNIRKIIELSKRFNLVRCCQRCEELRNIEEFSNGNLCNYCLETMSMEEKEYLNKEKAK